MESKKENPIGVIVLVIILILGIVGYINYERAREAAYWDQIASCEASRRTGIRRPDCE
jgi:hypothetical protein